MFIPFARALSLLHCLFSAFTNTLMHSHIRHADYSKDGYCPQLSHISVGRVKPDSLVNSRTAVVGAVAHYTCAHGYEIEGNPNRTCVSSVHGLHWTPSEKPRCTRMYVCVEHCCSDISVFSGFVVWYEADVCLTTQPHLTLKDHIWYFTPVCSHIVWQARSSPAPGCLGNKVP